MITLFIGLTILFAIFMWALGTVIGGLLPEGFFEEDENYYNYNEYEDLDKVMKNISLEYAKRYKR